MAAPPNSATAFLASDFIRLRSHLRSICRCVFLPAHTPRLALTMGTRMRGSLILREGCPYVGQLMAFYCWCFPARMQRPRPAATQLRKADLELHSNCELLVIGQRSSSSPRIQQAADGWTTWSTNHLGKQCKRGTRRGRNRGRWPAPGCRQRDRPGSETIPATTPSAAIDSSEAPMPHTPANPSVGMATRGPAGPNWAVAIDAAPSPGKATVGCGDLLGRFHGSRQRGAQLLRTLTGQVCMVWCYRRHETCGLRRPAPPRKISVR